jgi:hypothetical protein
MPVRVFPPVVLALLLAVPAIGAEDLRKEAAAAVSEKQLDLNWKGSDNIPSEELLEFLGEWEIPEAKRWLAPQDFAQLKPPETSDETTDK